MTRTGEHDAVDELDDEALAAAAAGGDFDAFETLAVRLSPKMYRLAWSFVRDDHAAEDVVQDALLSAHRALPRFEGKSKVGSWMYRITVNAALMRLRSKRRRPEVSLEHLSDAPGVGTTRESHLLVDRENPAGAAARAELRREVQAAVDALEEKYRVVFILRDVEGLSIAETGDVLDLSAAAVKSRLHRARLFLRASLERYVAE